MILNRIIPTKCSKDLKESDPMRTMISFFSIFCCFLTFSAFANERSQQELILSMPEQLAALTCEPDFLIGGLIGPLGGHPTLRETDLVVKGAQNIALTRIYIPPYMPCSFPQHKRCQEEYAKKHLFFHLLNNYQGWQFFPHTRLQYHKSRKEVRLSETNGATIDFKISTPTTTLTSPPYAINNVAGDTPHGKYDPRNTRVTQEYQGNQITVYAADGAVRFYYRAQWSTQTGYLLYLLGKEILPNGKILAISDNKTILFSYDPFGRRLNKTITLMTGTGCQAIEYEHYLYHGDDEIGAFVLQQPKNFRVCGLNRQRKPQTIALELEGKLFAPLLDVQGNIRGLIDPNTSVCVAKYQFTAFGEELSQNAETIFNPWRYASKRSVRKFGFKLHDENRQCRSLFT